MYTIGAVEIYTPDGGYQLYQVGKKPTYSQSSPCIIKTCKVTKISKGEVSSDDFLLIKFEDGVALEFSANLSYILTRQPVKDWSLD